MEGGKKRSFESSSGDAPNKKTKRQWQVPKKNYSSAPSIGPGDAGIWATCDMHKEGLCTNELKSFFDEYATSIYGDALTNNTTNLKESNDASNDIEAEINREVQGIQTPSQTPPFVPIKIDVQCVLFFKTREPVEPVSFVQRICSDVLDNATTRKTRHVKRLTPMTRMGKATEKSLEEVAKEVLAPVFHQNAPAQKFAIRTTIRNHHTMKRDDIIKRVADLVGERHKVDLTNYNHLIMVDIYRNVLGMSVVGSDFEKLKRFNLTELHESTPKSEAL
ncbi:MAG: hypothetical protein Q9220_006360 [cf. Caloplaca sp. 1 TL-2023]